MPVIRPRLSPVRHPALCPRHWYVAAPVGSLILSLGGCGSDESNGPGKPGLPTGRVVVWTSDLREIRMVNLDGSATRTIVAGVSSDGGAFPHFDPTRTRITLHNGYLGFGGAENIIVTDTTGTARRDVNLIHGASTVFNTRMLPDGTLLFVGQVASPIGLFRVGSDDAVTHVAVLPGLESGYNHAQRYGGADIAPDGTRVAYVAPAPSGSELRVLHISTGTVTALEPNARSPRWSAQGDRIAFIVPQGDDILGTASEGTVAVIKADGTERREFGAARFSRGLTWSPDGTYLLGRASDVPTSLRLVRISDGVSTLLRFPNAGGGFEDYWQPDWR